MRILHLLDEPYDSGIVHYALKAAQGANRRGHACSVWGLEGRYPVLEAQRRGIPTRGYSHPWLDLPALRRFLKEDGTQLLVAHTGAGHSLAVAAAWSGGAGIPVIRTRGDARPLRRRPGAGLLWSRTAGFIAANQVILDQFRELFGPEIPAAVVYEGREDPGPARPPANTAPTVGIVARLDPVKGHSVFLEAAAAAARTCPEARFLVVGREENVRSAELRELAHRLGIAEPTPWSTCGAATSGSSPRSAPRRSRAPRSNGWPWDARSSPPAWAASRNTCWRAGPDSSSLPETRRRWARP